MFEHFTNVQPQQKGQYFAPGRYRLEVVRCKVINTLQTGTAFVSTLKVLETSNETDQPLGSCADLFVQLSKAKYPQEAHARVAAFIFALAGASDTEQLPLPKILEAATSERNPLAGLTVRMVASHRQTKTGGIWTDLIFSPDGEGHRAAVLGAVGGAAPAAPVVQVPPGFFRAGDGAIVQIPPGFKLDAHGRLVQA